METKQDPEAGCVPSRGAERGHDGALPAVFKGCNLEIHTVSPAPGHL